MTTPITVGRIQERALDMVDRHHLQPKPASRDSRVECHDAIAQLHLVSRDQGRQALRYSRIPDGGEGDIEALGHDRWIVEVNSGKAVDLQVQEALGADHRFSPVAEAGSRCNVARE